MLNQTYEFGKNLDTRRINGSAYYHPRFRKCYAVLVIIFVVMLVFGVASILLGAYIHLVWVATSLAGIVYWRSLPFGYFGLGAAWLVVGSIGLISLSKGERSCRNMLALFLVLLALLAFAMMTHLSLTWPARVGQLSSHLNDKAGDPPYKEGSESLLDSVVAFAANELIVRLREAQFDRFECCGTVQDTGARHRIRRQDASSIADIDTRQNEMSEENRSFITDWISDHIQFKNHSIHAFQESILRHYLFTPVSRLGLLIMGALLLLTAVIVMLDYDKKRYLEDHAREVEGIEEEIANIASRGTFPLARPPEVLPHWDEDPWIFPYGLPNPVRSIPDVEWHIHSKPREDRGSNPDGSRMGMHSTQYLGDRQWQAGKEAKKHPIYDYHY